MNEGQPIKILSIDGGGIRGIYAAHILKRIQEATGIKYSDHFDLIAGTSTGSIIAAALATNYPIEDVCDLYEKQGKKMFSKQLFGSFGILRATYSNKYIKEQLDTAFGDKTMSDTATRLLIPSTNIGTAAVHVFKSNYNENFIRDKNVFIKDAVLASSSAPLFFRPHKVGEFMLSDGGLWANNPTLVSVIEAKKRLNADLKKIKVLSIGTGGEKLPYGQNPKIPRGWGFFTGWGGSKLISTILNLQSDAADNMTKLLLSPEQYLRINFKDSKKLPLDDYRAIPDLKSFAERDFADAITNIKNFLN